MSTNTDSYKIITLTPIINKQARKALESKIYEDIYRYGIPLIFLSHNKAIIMTPTLIIYKLKV